MAVSANVKLWTRSAIFADQGTYFVATNPTPGTALASAVNATFDVTKGLFVLRNQDAAGGKNIHLDYIKIIPTVAPASGTAAHFALYHDTVNRYTSGGTAITPVSASGVSNVGSIAGVFASSGATVITVAAAGSKAKLIARGVMRSVIPAVGDEMILSFGAEPNSGSSSATAAGKTVTNVPPTVLTPGDNLALIHWFPSNAVTGISYEFEIGYVEQAP